MAAAQAPNCAAKMAASTARYGGILFSRRWAIWLRGIALCRPAQRTETGVTRKTRPADTRITRRVAKYTVSILSYRLSEARSYRYLVSQAGQSRDWVALSWDLLCADPCHIRERFAPRDLGEGSIRVERLYLLLTPVTLGVSRDRSGPPAEKGGDRAALHRERAHSSAVPAVARDRREHWDRSRQSPSSSQHREAQARRRSRRA